MFARHINILQREEQLIFIEITSLSFLLFLIFFFNIANTRGNAILSSCSLFPALVDLSDAESCSYVFKFYIQNLLESIMCEFIEVFILAIFLY